MTKPKKSSSPKAARLTFPTLVLSIRNLHRDPDAQAGRALNLSLTLRNWLIGCYIAEYELKGSDRARYGGRGLGRLAVQLQKNGVSRSEDRELRPYRQFYLTYPQIRESLPHELQRRLIDLRSAEAKIPAPSSRG